MVECNARISLISLLLTLGQGKPSQASLQPAGATIERAAIHHAADGRLFYFVTADSRLPAIVWKSAGSGRGKFKHVIACSIGVVNFRHLLKILHARLHIRTEFAVHNLALEGETYRGSTLWKMWRMYWWLSSAAEADVVVFVDGDALFGGCSLAQVGWVVGAAGW